MGREKRERRTGDLHAEGITRPFLPSVRGTLWITKDGEEMGGDGTGVDGKGGRIREREEDRNEEDSKRMDRMEANKRKQRR